MAVAGSSVRTSSRRAGSRGPAPRAQPSEVDLAKAKAQRAALEAQDTIAMAPLRSEVAEEKAWELLLGIAGAHAQGDPAGRVELRRIVAEARRLLVAAPVAPSSGEAQSLRRVAGAVSNGALNAKVKTPEALSVLDVLRAVFAALYGLVSLVGFVISTIAAAAMGEATPQLPSEASEEPKAQPRAQPKAASSKASAARRSALGRHSGTPAATASPRHAEDEESEDEEEEDTRSSCTVA
ncbi:unnamed protein product [Polarella glacialis]|uniref:Transmembrane protein n=1 Tax=Polarella glacialis TaxID=89957 RepID=A0A813M1I7_POLGL|nr:unnamed protein product [Polarella glacialis]